MSNVWFKRIPILLLLVLAFAPVALVSAQTTVPYAFLLVRPANVDSKLEPYVIQIQQSDEAFGIIFPESVQLTLFAPINNPMNLQVNPVIPHTQSGGYRLVDTIIWSAFTYGIDGTNSQDLNDPAFATLRDEDLIDPNFLAGTRPQVVSAVSEILIISPTLYSPATSGDRYEACSIREDVKGVVSIDFAQDSDTNPVFQMVQLGVEPVRFRLPSLGDTIDLIAVANNQAPEDANPGIQRFTLSNQDLGNQNLLDRDVFAEEQGNLAGTPPDYSRLYASLDRAQSRMFPLYVQVVTYVPGTQFLSFVFKDGPACRNLVIAATNVVPISGTSQEGIPYFLAGRTEASGTLKPDESVTVRTINIDGTVCFDNPTERPAEGSPAQQVCAVSWSLMQAPEGE